MQQPHYRLEICAASVASCLAAQAGGAHRVELCSALPEGGTTPSLGLFVVAQSRVEIPLYPIIRPRSGDFLYSPDEVAVMEAEIEQFVAHGARGVVIGALTAMGDLDREVLQRLISAARGADITLHRAFDMCRDKRLALETAVSLGISRILTSGGALSAHAGIETLARLVEQAAGRISIMAGAGVTPDNIAEIARRTGVKELHASLRRTYSSGMLYRNPAVSMGGAVTIDEYAQSITDPLLVAKALSSLDSIKESSNSPIF